jgi:hypothetical protein
VASISFFCRNAPSTTARERQSGGSFTITVATVPPRDAEGARH